MSYARGFGLNGKSIYQNICMPCDVWLNFVIDPTNGNGYGIRSLKSNGYVQNVYMQSLGGPVPGTPLEFAVARTYAALANSAITNTGSSVLTGNIGITPNNASSITGFPPGTYSGMENAANPAAVSAMASAQATYNDLSARSATNLGYNALDGHTITPGVYTFPAGDVNLAQSGAGAVTLNGNGLYVFIIPSTLTTGAGGTPTMTLSGGANASNIYWIVGTSATINSGHAGTFQGNIIANTSITDTSGGTVNGTLAALNGAVTYSAAAISNASPLSLSASGPASGFCWINFKNNFNKYLGGFSGFVSPLSGTPLTSVVAGNAYVIVSLGTATLAQWQAVGVPQGFVPSIGMSFVASVSQAIGGSAAVEAPLASGIQSVEVVGDPNQMISNSNLAANAGAWLLVQFLYNGVPTAPVPQSVVGMKACWDRSTVSIPDGGPTNAIGNGGL